jgi:hypothetical protein
MTIQVAKFIFQISIILMTTNTIAAMDNGKRFDDSKEVTFMTYHMVNTTVAISGAETDYTSGIPTLIPGFWWSSLRFSQFSV